MQHPIFSNHCAQLPIEAIHDISRVSYSSLTSAISKAAGGPSKLLRASSRMEQAHYDRVDQRQARLRPRQSSPSIRIPHQAIQLDTAPSTTPIPHSHWDSVPLPYRPRDWEQPFEPISPLNTPASAHVWRFQSNRRRPAGAERAFTGRDINTQGSAMDVTMLYPPMNASDQPETRPASDPGFDFYRRAFSQPNTPNFDQLQHEPEEPSSTIFARAPGFEPSGRRRDRRATAADTTFTADEDFSLFAQATAGLGCEDALRHLDTGPEIPYRLPPYQGDRPPMLRTRSERIASPVEQTPTTMYALHSLAQMPQDLPERQRLEGRRLEIQRLQASIAGNHLWMDPPGAGSDGEFSPVDEELPDYAASQAQAHASQRAEAARRAQELRRRWEQSR